MKTVKLMRGFTLPELLIFLAALVIPIVFLVYFSPEITAQVYDYQVKKNLREIYRGLHVYAAQDSELAFPKGSTAEESFRKVFTAGNITDPMVFDDPRLPGEKPSGTPGPLFLTPSVDLKGVDFLYNKQPLTMRSESYKVIVATRSLPGRPKAKFFTLLLDGRILEEKTPPSGDFS